MKATLDGAGVMERDAALRPAAGQPFYNTSPFTLRDLRARANPRQFRADFEAWLDGFSPNVQDILDSIYADQLKRLALTLPPPSERAAIPRFLDHATYHIDHNIRAKEKLIALLEEQRRVIMHVAVTGRVYVRTSKPYVTYRPSGVEWLRDVPGNLEKLKLKRWLKVNQRTLPNDTNPDYKSDYVDIVSAGTGRLLTQPERVRLLDAPTRARRIVRPGYTILSKVRTCLKAIWRLNKGVSELIASTGFVSFAPKATSCSKFVSQFCQSEHFINRTIANSVGVAYPAFAVAKVQAFDVEVPPPSEQTAIGRFLDECVAGVRSAIDRTKRQIALLREYRTRLIADVVTGKLDVREAAASLPGESEIQDTSAETAGLGALHRTEEK